MSLLKNYYIRTFLRFIATNALPEELFKPDIDFKCSQRLFKSYVKLFEVEHHSYCNRTCWFCPNSSIDRRSQNIRMEKELLLKMLNELAGIDYDQSFIWCGYGEPLADETIFEDVRLAKHLLPNAYHKLFSNGDYLTTQAIQRLEGTGLDQLRVSLYPESNGDLETPKLLKGLSERTGLRIAYHSKKYKGLQLIGSRMLVVVEIKDFRRAPMSSRGGYLTKESGHGSYVRTLPCFFPILHMSVAYDGKCMLCCQVRPDVPGHQSAIIGDLNNKDYSIFHYYRDLALARKVLVSPGAKTGVCTSCSINPFGGGPYNTGRIQNLSKILNVLHTGELMNKLWLFPRRDRQRYILS